MCQISAVQAYIKKGLPLAQGMELAYVVKKAKKWEVDPARKALEFDADYYGGLLEKAWGRRHLFFVQMREK
jgi:DNA polymerase I